MIWSFKHLFRIVRFTFFAAAILFLFLSCDFDQGLGPSKTRITGKVLFLDTNLRPANVDEVRVIAVSQLPPSGFGDIYFSNAVRFDQDTAAYEIQLPAGNFPAAGVLWKPRGKDWAITNLLGIYGFTPPVTFSLKAVEVTQDQPVAENVDIFALWSFSEFDASIEGNLELVGEWPSNTDVVLLGAFLAVPDLENLDLSVIGLLGGLPLPITKPATSEASERAYGLSVRNGEYKFIGIFWKAKGSNNIRCIGFYRDPANATQPGSAVVGKDGNITGYDLIGDFATLPDGVKIGGMSE
jgi:hypothetical protein